MRIDIKTISRTIGASLEIKTIGSPEEIALSFPGYEFLQPVEFDGVVSNAGNDVLVLKGIVGTEGTSRCARCLREVVSRIEANVDVPYASQYHRDRTTLEISDPEEEYTYTGYSIELDRALRDSLILALPFRVLCGADCKGICEWCGGDLNEKDCKCSVVHENGTSLLEESKNLL